MTTKATSTTTIANEKRKGQRERPEKTIVMRIPNGKGFHHAGAGKETEDHHCRALRVTPRIRGRAVRMLMVMSPSSAIRVTP